MTAPEPTPDPEGITEADAERALALVFSRVEAVRDLLPHIADPLPLTPLERDDRASHPHKVSQAVTRSVTAAVEHLDALRVLVMEARRLHPSAPFTLARAAIECGSAAVWMLAPTEHRERVVRALRHAAQDARDGTRAAVELGAELPRPLDERIGDMRALAATVEHEGRLESPTSTECVAAADEVVDAVYPVTTMWRVCSGFAHGRTWATLAFLEREVHATTPTDVVLRVTSSLDRVLMVTLTATEVVDQALRLYSDRNTSVYVR